MISQLASSGKVKKMFAHCLNGINGGGIFAIGHVVQPKVKMTPLLPDQYAIHLIHFRITFFFLVLLITLLGIFFSFHIMFLLVTTLYFFADIVVCFVIVEHFFLKKNRANLTLKLAHEVRISQTFISSTFAISTVVGSQ